MANVLRVSKLNALWWSWRLQLFRRFSKKRQKTHVIHRTRA